MTNKKPEGFDEAQNSAEEFTRFCYRAEPIDQSDDKDEKSENLGGVS